MENIEQEYQKFEAMSQKEKRDFIKSLSLDDKVEFLFRVMDKTGLLLSDIMNSLGIWKLE